jgi:hypothetical protein
MYFTPWRERVKVTIEWLTVGAGDSSCSGTVESHSVKIYYDSLNNSRNYIVQPASRMEAKIGYFCVGTTRYRIYRCNNA